MPNVQTNRSVLVRLYLWLSKSGGRMASVLSLKKGVSFVAYTFRNKIIFIPLSLFPLRVRVIRLVSPSFIAFAKRARLKTEEGDLSLKNLNFHIMHLCVTFGGYLLRRNSLWPFHWLNDWLNFWQFLPEKLLFQNLSIWAFASFSEMMSVLKTQRRLTSLLIHYVPDVKLFVK